MTEKFRQYISLTKPGVLFGNVLTGAAGFCLASSLIEHFYWKAFIAVMVGMTLVIASACSINNVLDQDIDRLMERTRERAVASGQITTRRGAIFSFILGALGFLTLITWSNFAVVTAGTVGFFTYVVLYGMYSKRRSELGTLVGSVSGAMPILAGYLAVSNHLDIAAIILFLCLFFWQMPEFYSIAIYRRKEYKAAGVPVISLRKGVDMTKKHILLYVVCFVISSILLWVFGFVGYVYLAVMSVLGLVWVYQAVRGLSLDRAKQNLWARAMFKLSINILLIFSLVVAAGKLLP